MKYKSTDEALRFLMGKPLENMVKDIVDYIPPSVANTYGDTDMIRAANYYETYISQVKPMTSTEISQPKEDITITETPKTYVSSESKKPEQKNTSTTPYNCPEAMAEKLDKIRGLLVKDQENLDNFYEIERSLYNSNQAEHISERNKLAFIANYVRHKEKAIMEETKIPTVTMLSVRKYILDRFDKCEELTGSFADIVDTLNIEIDAETLMFDFLTSDKCSQTDLALFLSEYLICESDKYGYDLTKEVGLDDKMLHLMNIGDKCNVRGRYVDEVFAVGFRVSSLALVDKKLYTVEDYVPDEKINADRAFVVGDKIVADVISKDFLSIAMTY